jgi:hypothetical protein
MPVPDQTSACAAVNYMIWLSKTKNIILGTIWVRKKLKNLLSPSLGAAG